MRLLDRLWRLAALILLPACVGLQSPPLDDHVIAAPISARANVVLENLVTEYGSRDGRWLADMSPGCAEIWATQFGYRAGCRRDRDDLVALAEATADRVSADIRGLAFDAVFGEVDQQDPALYGFPALLASATLGGSTVDGILFSMGLDRIDGIAGSRPLDARESAGLAALLAETARLDPDERDDHLDRAREIAEGATGGGGGTWEAFAWAAIARASGHDEDAERARRAVDASAYFDPSTGALAPLDAAGEVLSRHLALIHALADLAGATSEPIHRARALRLLEKVFSDDWFDGRFLVHDRQFGRSRDVCSGCNFLALYLVDRLYGDAFVIDPVPPLPRREHEEREPPEREASHTLVLGPGSEDRPERTSAALEGLSREGDLLIRHSTSSAKVGFVYRTVGPDLLPPYGGVMAKVSVWLFPLLIVKEAAFDETGSARFSNLGNAPLLLAIELTRRADGRLDASVLLTEDGDD